jgi:hypothetical protein
MPHDHAHCLHNYSICARYKNIYHEIRELIGMLLRM